MRVKELLQENRLNELTDGQRRVVFGESDEMICVDAKHFDAYGDCGELEDTIYTWYVPQYYEKLGIVPGDTLVVETTVGHGLSLAIAVSTPYRRHISELQEVGHPYCGLVMLLHGAVDLADGRTTYDIELG